MSEKPYELPCKMFSAVPERTEEELESILGEVDVIRQWELMRILKTKAERINSHSRIQCSR